MQTHSRYGNSDPGSELRLRRVRRTYNGFLTLSAPPTKPPQRNSHAGARGNSPCQEVWYGPTVVRQLEGCHDTPTFSLAALRHKQTTRRLARAMIPALFTIPLWTHIETSKKRLESILIQGVTRTSDPRTTAKVLSDLLNVNPLP